MVGGGYAAAGLDARVSVRLGPLLMEPTSSIIPDVRFSSCMEGEGDPEAPAGMSLRAFK